MVGKGSMSSGGRSNFGPAPKFTSPQESRLPVDQDLAPSTLEAFTPGLVSQPEFDGASFDHESPFAHESSFSGMNNSTSNLAEQMRTLGETPRTGAEQMGITIPRAESRKPLSGDIFNSNDFKQQKRLEQLRKENPEIAQNAATEQRAKSLTHIPEREEKSSVRLSAEQYAVIRQQKTEEQRQKLAALQVSKKTAVAAGGVNLTHNVTPEADSSKQTLMRFALKRFNEIVHREKVTAAQMAAGRRAKMAAHKGGLDMGGKERSSSTAALEFAQAESGHEWAGNDMGD